MGRIPLIAAALSLLIAPPSFAQDWIEYVSQNDLFSENFPGQPKVESITYSTFLGLNVPARVYSASDGQGRYSVTAVDFTNAAKLHAERSKTCVASDAYPDQCNDQGGNELRGAMDHAVFNFMQRDAKITFYSYAQLELVEGKQLQLTNADGSRTFAAIHMHENRLYIAEGTVPKGAPQPGLFQQSLGFIDKDGKRVRYASTYHNAYPPPPRSR
jgi:hypothetical protein